MEYFEGIATFACVVETKSFSAAAKHLDMSKSLVSKQITHLEQSLGARLLHRTTRAMSLTDAGSAFYGHCAHVMKAFEAAKLEVSQLHSEPRGVLRIGASVAFGTRHIAPALPEFLSLYPEVKVDLTITDRFVDLAAEGYDVAVRIAKEPAKNLVARRLAAINRKICASPEYFARHGIPRTPSDLERHNCLLWTCSNSQELWRLHGPEGEISVHASGNVKMDNNEAMSRAVLGGLGIALLPTFIIGPDLQAGRLQSVLLDYVSPSRSVYAIYLPNRQLSGKVRAFIDYLSRTFGPEPYWDRVTTRVDRDVRHVETAAFRHRVHSRDRSPTKAVLSGR